MSVLLDRPTRHDKGFAAAIARRTRAHSKVNGPVSDEKAQQMLHDGPPSDDAGEADSEYSEADRATNEQDLTLEQ